jgi:hypothetical protein
MSLYPTPGTVTRNRAAFRSGLNLAPEPGNEHVDAAIERFHTAPCNGVAQPFTR